MAEIHEVGEYEKLIITLTRILLKNTRKNLIKQRKAANR
jgi:hypothetical protein